LNLLLKIGLDTGCADGSIAWALDYPRCTASGKDGSEAILNMPRAFLQHCDWTVKHSAASWLADVGNFDLRLVETFECYSINKDFERTLDGSGYEVGSFFLDDWKPLTAEDVRRALLLLEWSRADLLGILSGLTTEQRAQNHPGERWSIDGILKHVGGAEWGYMDNLRHAGLERAELSEAPDERLAQVRGRLRELLPALVGMENVVGREGELWSPRKVLRRALWHEMDHIGHILKLI
jgi:hypothetical protein